MQPLFQDSLQRCFLEKDHYVLYVPCSTQWTLFRWLHGKIRLNTSSDLLSYIAAKKSCEYHEVHQNVQLNQLTFYDCKPDSMPALCQVSATFDLDGDARLSSQGCLRLPPERVAETHEWPIRCPCKQTMLRPSP